MFAKNSATFMGCMSKERITILVFALCYALFVVFPNRRSWVACGGSLLLVMSGAIGWRDAVLEKINWNVMGLFFGTLILAELFMLSRAPAVMSEWLVDRMRAARGAMLVLCVLSGAISVFVENVAVVLLVSPVAMSLAEKLKINPVRLLIGIAVSSNLQGTATMIGDPPSMILAGHLKMSFLDFFVYQGRLGIFFAVEIGAVVSLMALWFLFRAHREPISVVPVEKARSWAPSWFLALLIVGLSFASLADPNFAWFAGVFTMIVAVVALVWLRFRFHWQPIRQFGRALDWDTTFFLAGVFVLVGGLSDSGWLDRLAGAIAAGVGASLPLAFVAIVALAVAVSAFVDNVPFLLAMIPVAEKVAEQMDAPMPVLMFGLLIGACLGGNLTPIGASANVVAIGLLRKRGFTVGFREFFGVGFPFTIVAVTAACLFVWIVWAP
ncbi:MAG: SLC13 family permease [Verrucomicrobiota bacterium]|nr:SLC13 family permease [Verrucomicrobiota bacterium]